MRSDKHESGHKFHFGKRFIAAERQNAPGRKTGPMRLGKYLVAAGLFKCRLGLCLMVEKVSEPIQDLVGPEPLEPVQRLVECREFLVRDAADLLHGLDVLLIQRVDDAADFLALRGKANTDRAAIDTRAPMI